MAKKNNKKGKPKPKKTSVVPPTTVTASVAADPVESAATTSLNVPESATATETTAETSPTSPVTVVSPLAVSVAEEEPGSSQIEEEEEEETSEESPEPSSPEGTTPVLTVQPNALAAEPTVETVDVSVPVPVEPEEVQVEDPVVEKEVQQPEEKEETDKDFFQTLSKEEDGDEVKEEAVSAPVAPAPISVSAPSTAGSGTTAPTAPSAATSTIEEQLTSRLMEDPVVEQVKHERHEEVKQVEEKLTEKLMSDPVVEQVKHERKEEDKQVEDKLTQRLMEDPVVEAEKEAKAKPEPVHKPVQPVHASPPESKEDDFFSNLGDETAEKSVAETQPEPVASKPAPAAVAPAVVAAPEAVATADEDDFFSGLGKPAVPEPVAAAPAAPAPTPAVAVATEEDDFMKSLSEPNKEQVDPLPQDDFFSQLGSDEKKEEVKETAPESAAVPEPKEVKEAPVESAPEDDFFSQLGKTPEKAAAPAAAAVAAPVRGHKVQPSEADFFAQLGGNDPPAAHEPPQPQPITLSLDEDDDLLLTDEDEQAEVLAEAGKPNPPAQSFAFLEDDDLLESDQDFLETDDEDEEPIAQTGGDFRANQQHQGTYFPSAPAVPAAPSAASRYTTPVMPAASQFGPYGSAQATPNMYQPASSQSTPSAAAAAGKRIDKNKSDAFDFPTGMIPKTVKKTRSHQQLPQSAGLMPAFGAAGAAATPPGPPGMPPMGPPAGRPATNPYAPAPAAAPSTAPKKSFFEELPTIPVKPISRQPSYALSPPRAPFAQEAAQQPRRVSDGYGAPHHGGHPAGVHSAPVSHHNSVSGPSNPYAPPSGPAAVPPKTSSPYAPPPAGVPPKTASPYAPPPPAVPPKTSSPYAPPPVGHGHGPSGHGAPSGPPAGPPRGSRQPAPQPPAAAAAAAVAAAAAAGPPPAGPPRVSSRNAYAPPRGAPARGSTPPVVAPAMAYSPNVSPKRVVQGAQNPSPRSRYSEFKDIGQKSTVSDETLRKRQFPIFRWSNSKTATCLIAPQIGYATAVSQTSVRLLDVSQVVSTGEDVTRFPGPLFNAKAPIKSKKKELEKWVGDHVALLDTQNADADRVLLWKLVGVFLSNDGVLNSSQVRAFLTPHFEQSATGDGSAFTSAMDLSSSSFVPQQGDNGPSFSGSDANHVLRHLQSGSKDAAIRHCMDRRLWGHSLLIASTMGPEKWRDVVAEFIKDDVRPLYKPTLQFLYSSFGGVTPSAESYGDWKETVSYILSNSKDDGSDLSSLVALGDSLVEKGYVAAGHFCYVVSRAPLADKITLLGSEGRDLDAILLSETYEFALGLKTNVAIPQMQLYKLVHAEVLADLGNVSQAQRYAEYLNQSLKAFSDKTTTFQPAYISRLIALSDRVSSTPGATTGSWFSRPKLDKVLGHLDKSLSKFVAGEEAAVAGASSASDTVFSQIAATPGISRTTSVVDLSQGMASGYQQPAYGPTRASTGNILRPQGAAGAYDRPSLPRSSSAMDAGPAGYGYERAPSVASVHSVQSDYPRVMSPLDAAGGFGGAAYPPAGGNAYAPPGATAYAGAGASTGASAYGPPAGASAYAPAGNAYAPPAAAPAAPAPPTAPVASPYAPAGSSPYAPPAGAPVPHSFSPRQPAYGRSYASTPEHHIEEETEEVVEPEYQAEYEPEQEYEPEPEQEPEPEPVPPPPAPAPKAAPKAAPSRAPAGPRKVAPQPKPQVKPAYNPYDPGSPVKEKKPAGGPAGGNKYAPVNSAYSPGAAYTPPAVSEKQPEQESYGAYGGYGGYDPYSGYEAPTPAAEPEEDETVAEDEAAGESEAAAAEYDYGAPSYGYQSQAADDAGDYGDDEGAIYTPAAVTLPPISNLPPVPLPGLEPVSSTPPSSRYAAPPAADEDEDDFGIGNKPAAKKEDKPAAADKDEPKDGKKGWFGGWFKKGEQMPADDKKVYKAKLGEKSNFYYSEEHKRWINGDMPIEDQVKGAGGPPPPPKMTKKAPAPPAASGPPSGASSMPPSRPASGAPPAPGAPTGAPAAGPPRPKVVDPLEGFLTGGPPAGAPRKGARKSAKSRYVDIMNN